MKVEVNEVTIVRFNLVGLTGNSTAELMELAEEAKASGYVLTVEIPDDVLVHANVFDTTSSRVVEEEPEVRNPIEGEFVSGEVIERSDD